MDREIRGCYPKQRACPNGKVQALISSSVWNPCGAKPTVSLKAGEIPNLRASNASAFPLKGDCSADGTGNVKVFIEDSSDFIETSVNCAGGSWTASVDLSALVNKKEVFTVKVLHQDPSRRKSLLAKSTFNAVCPDNYVLAPPLSGYTSRPFCVAKYEMRSASGTATSQAEGTPWAVYN